MFSSKSVGRSTTTAKRPEAIVVRLPSVETFLRKVEAFHSLDAGALDAQPLIDILVCFQLKKNNRTENK